MVGIGGSIQTRSYEAKDGTRRYVTEVVAEEVQFLEPKSGSGQGASNQINDYPSEFKEFEGEYRQVDDDGEIPF